MSISSSEKKTKNISNGLCVTLTVGPGVSLNCDTGVDCMCVIIIGGTYSLSYKGKLCCYIHNYVCFIYLLFLQFDLYMYLLLVSSVTSNSFTLSFSSFFVTVYLSSSSPFPLLLPLLLLLQFCIPLLVLLCPLSTQPLLLPPFFLLSCGF